MLNYKNRISNAFKTKWKAKTRKKKKVKRRTRKDIFYYCGLAVILTKSDGPEDDGNAFEIMQYKFIRSINKSPTVDDFGFPPEDEDIPATIFFRYYEEIKDECEYIKDCLEAWNQAGKNSINHFEYPHYKENILKHRKKTQKYVKTGKFKIKEDIKKFKQVGIDGYI